MRELRYTVVASQGDRAVAVSMTPCPCGFSIDDALGNKHKSSAGSGAAMIGGQACRSCKYYKGQPEKLHIKCAHPALDTDHKRGLE